jgi:hypothetical protein
MKRSLWFVIPVVWGASALTSGLLASRKARSPRKWALLGAALGPLALVAHAFYPSRYAGRKIACPRCGKPVADRAVACHHCQYRFPAVDVLITRLPEDLDSRRFVTSEVAREYGIGYPEADRMLATLPVAGYRHVIPEEVDDYVRRLAAVGAVVEVVTSPPDLPVR